MGEEQEIKLLQARKQMWQDHLPPFPGEGVGNFWPGFQFICGSSDSLLSAFDSLLSALEALPSDFISLVSTLEVLLSALDAAFDFDDILIPDFVFVCVIVSSAFF